MNHIGRHGLSLSTDTRCLLDIHVARLEGERTYRGAVVGYGERDFARITEGDAVWWADAITGQLYHPDTLACESGPLRLAGTPKPTNKKLPRRRLLS